MPIAYVFLIQVGEQVRLADYGPAGLDENSSMVLGIGVRDFAKSSFPTATSIMIATSETAVSAGISRAGFRLRREEPIRVLKTEKALENIHSFRLTLLDWDALFS
jgi:hypothetical protein